MFVEKLSKVDIQGFLGESYKLNSLHVYTGSLETYIVINASSRNSNYSYAYKLSDTMGMDNDIKWVRFLYHKFGEDYKKWYINKQLSIFD